MIYEKSRKAAIDPEEFRNPGSDYRGAPFWAWNCRLDKDRLLREIEQIKAMGMGGFHIHCRSGLETKYLGDEFMKLVVSCDEKAKKENMLCWLYDEDRWPSGYGGGYVTENHRFRARYLVLEPLLGGKARKTEYSSSGRAVFSRERTLLGRYFVKLRDDGRLESYRRLKAGEEKKDEDEPYIWEAWLEVSGDNPWFNNQAYVNTLDKNAVRKFLEVTHERYYEFVGEEFGRSIPAIFTDEPQFPRKECLRFPEERKSVVLPFTDDFEETFAKSYGMSILDHLPELVWELPEGAVSRARYCYHDHVSERFAAAYADTVGNWCRDHGLMLTGHMMDEPTLESQTGALGDCMRSYRSFDLPGIDMLCDQRELTTAKQAESASHQYGRRGMMSEIYGVTNWDFDFRGHKLAGDWQAALGVTLRVHHLSWVSMRGEAKRDYPASIGYQSPWYREYHVIEDHFARLNTALTRGCPAVRVGVIHPVESYWLHWGPVSQTENVRREMDKEFQDLTSWLLYGLIDFDFISESLLPSQAGEPENGRFVVGRMSYDVVIVPNCETLRSTTLHALEKASAAGCRVIFAGKPARFMDARESGEPARFAETCGRVSFNRAEILDSLEKIRDVDVRKETGERSDNLFYQMRLDGRNRWLFLCHVNPMRNPDIASAETVSIAVRGEWEPSVYDTMTGEIRRCRCRVENGLTKIMHRFSQHDSLLILLEPAGCAGNRTGKAVGESNELPDLSGYRKSYLPEPNFAARSEPNVLLLDMADYSFDDGEWQEKEELLRIDNKFRRLLGYPLRMESLAQPWAVRDEERSAHVLRLKFRFMSELEVDGAFLALEDPQNAGIFLNGHEVENRPFGWFVDESISRVRLPRIRAGENEILLTIPFNRKTNVEWCYLLGEFGVSVSGREARIVKTPERLLFGDWVGQGFPFYAGNVTYECSFESGEGDAYLEVSHFRAPVVSASVDGKKAGLIAFAPYLLSLGHLDRGVHRVALTAYGNRINSFGAVHNADEAMRYMGPNAWRTEGSAWSYEYRLSRMGILTTPTIWMK